MLSLDYKKAFLLCRKHRIDMNLIVDHAPEIFVNNIDRFVAEVEDADYLNLFITSLNDQDVTKTLYKTGYHHTSASTTSDSPSFFRYIIFIVFLLFLKILYYTLVALNHLKSISYVTNFDFRLRNRMLNLRNTSLPF